MFTRALYGDGRATPRASKTPAVVLLAMVMFACAPAAAADERLVADADTLRAAISAAEPGDTIVMRNGTWRDLPLRFDAKGTKGHPVTLRAETPGKVVVTGTSAVRYDGNRLVIEALVFRNVAPPGSAVVTFGTASRPRSDCRLSNCAFIDDDEAPREKCYWVVLNGERNRVTHCRFTGKRSQGPTLVVSLRAEGSPNDHLIDHNHFNGRPEGNGNGYETIRIGNSRTSMVTSRSVVEDNLFVKCDGEIEIISNKCCENVYRRNTFLNCRGMLTLRHGNRCVVDGNVFLGAGNDATGGVRICGESHRVINNYFEDAGATSYRAAISIMNGRRNSALNGYFRVKDCVIAHNTIVNAKWSITSGGNHDKNAPLPPVSTLIADNIVLSNHSPLIKYYGRESPAITYSRNIMYGADLGIAKPLGIRVLDPKLVKGSDGLYRPTTDSPAVGGGSTDIGADIQRNMDGQPRSSKRSIGADEPSESPVRAKALGPADVGPKWDRERAAGR